MAKLAPSDLAQVLSKLPAQKFSEDVLVGYDTADDAGVFKISNDLALVHTVDFFTPMTDDAEIYGQIAAVNSLNDIYAMGGKPLSALSIVCFPQKGDWKILEDILRGGQKMMNSEGAIILGGHSIDDQEIKFGYAVTGVIHPEKICRNSTAKDGDILILTKPIGTGAISTAIKFGKANENSVEAAIKTMTKSAARASKVMQEVGANACTDVTGFGLLGHAYEMAKGSRMKFVIESEKVQLLPNVLELISQKMLTRGDKNNRAYVGNTVKFSERVSGEMQSALYDPQTAGGLLISLEKEKAQRFLQEIDDAKIIGRVETYRDFLIEVE